VVNEVETIGIGMISLRNRDAVVDHEVGNVVDGHSMCVRVHPVHPAQRDRWARIREVLWLTVDAGPVLHQFLVTVGDHDKTSEVVSEYCPRCG
jgi:hypothetical protein